MNYIAKANILRKASTSERKLYQYHYVPWREERGGGGEEVGFRQGTYMSGFLSKNEFNLGHLEK